MRRLLSVLVAAFMLLTMPITTGIARAVADGTTEPAEAPSESIELEVEEMDPAKLHVHKLGEENADEEEGDGFDPAELEITDLNKIVRASIFLDGKSTIDTGYEVQSSGAKSYRDKLRRQQETMQQKIEQKIGHELTVKWNLTLLANAISVEIPYKDVALIRGMEGVKSVELETQYEAPEPVDAEPNTANTSANMVGAQYAWNTLGYTGAGSRVAIIDTGIDATHQSFADAGFNHAIELVRAEGKTVDLMSSIPSSGLNASGAIKLNNGDKIPFAYNYVDRNTTMTHNDAGSNHGSHVAGIAAANRFIKNGSNWEEAVDYVGAVGMAPDAQLLIMKVFGAGGGAYDSDYFAAIEDAVVLEADAANLSLGSGAPGYTYASSSYQAILNGLVNKENLHMVLSISAGNAYAADQFTSHKLYAEDASFHTGGSPGSYVHSMGVAAAQNTLTTGTPLMFNGSQQVFYAESTEDSDGNTYTNPAISTIAGSYNFVYIDATGEAEDYSTVNSAVSLSGKIVIINRGDISFSEKGNNAKSYNPKALIVANNDDGTILMNLADYTGTFPMVSITLKDANTIKENSTSATTGGITYYTGTVQVTTDEVSTVTPREDAEITDFSSWGVPGSLLMKPDITAPGGDIYSVYGIDGSSTTASNQYGLMSGTSMAAPHITGLSAVLMQYLRENAPDNADLMSGYNLRAIAQSLLMSTATPMINQGAFLSILQQGAGLVEVSKAIEAKSVIMMDEAYLTTETNAHADGKVKVELGDDPEKAGEYTYKFTIYNLTDKTLEYELGTILFTQAVNGDTLSRRTAILPLGGDSYEWNGQAPAEDHDVNKDGETNDLDAQAILDEVAGLIDIDDESYDFTVADMDGDEMITSRDAKLLLDWEGGEAQEGYFVGPNDKAQVTVHINLTAEQKAALEKEGGAWLEGYTYVDCVTADQEGVSYEHEHTIPILGYFGSFTDASMFDTNSYTENLYGNDQLNYSGNAAAGTNYMRITTNGTLAKFSGNPYMVEDNGFPTDRLAIRSDAKINDIAYNMIRNAGGTGFAVTKLDEDGNVSDIVYSTVTGQSVEGLWYYVNGGTWQNTMTKTYNVNKALNEYSGISEGDRVRVGFYAIPEYNVMKVSGDMTAADAGTLTAPRFTQILTDNVLGKGAFVGFDFTVDDTAPTFTSNPTLSGSTLTVYASDDQNLAYVGILSLDGSVIYKQVAPGTPTAEVSIDATDAIANAQGYVAVFIADYAGNEAAYAVKVNNNTHVEKTVYVLTSTVTSGDDYLIMNTNAAGAGYALYYTVSTSWIGNQTATAGAVATAVQAGTADTNGQPYVESADVAATSVWTAGTGSTNGTFTFNNNGWYLRRSNQNNLTITKDTSRRDWTWNGTNNRLSINSRYLRYANNTFSLNTDTQSVYMYVKTTISYEVDPYSVMSVTVSPATLDLYRGDTASLTAKVAPLTATDRSVTWSSDNPSIATVSDVGVVTAVAAGTTTIKATSNADQTKFGECHVTVVAINKELSAAVWDENGDVFFSYFNANNLPTWTKRHDTGTGVYVTSAMMASTSDLYACTNDLSTSYMYTVNRTSYAMTQTGENYVVPFGMAPVGSSFGQTDYFVFAFAKYILFGNLQPETDDDYGTYCGFPYGLLDLSTTDVGDAYAVAICARNIGMTSAGYYFLDETGKIWQTNQSYSSSSGISFSSPTFVYDTGITAGLQYNSIYYDGTHLYWTHQDGDYAELYILANANDSSNRKFYRAGNFGENVWPVAGLYTNGSVAPASVEPGDEIMSEELDGVLNLKPLMSREELMTPEIMERLAAAAEEYNSKIVVPEAIDEEPIELPEMPNEEPEEPVEEPEEPVEEPEEPVEEPEEPVEEPEEPAEEPEEPEDGAKRFHLLQTVYGEAEEDNGSKIAFAENEDSENGLFAVVYDPETLTLTDNAKGTAENLYVAINVDAEKGIVTVAYAMKGETPLAANTPIATLTFEAQTCGDSEDTIEIDTLERGEVLDLDDQEEIDAPTLDHDWDEPTWEWEGSDEEGWEAATATFVCKRDESHTQNVEAEVTSAAGTGEDAGYTIYTATVEFEGETYTDVKKVLNAEQYYLIGSMTNWQVDEAYKFTPNGEVEGEYILNTTLAVSDELKVVKVQGATQTWYPDGVGNYVVDYPHSGNVNVYFRPAGNVWTDFFTGGYFYISRLHTVTVITDGNGTAAVDPATPDVTETVTLTATANEGYHFDHVDFYEKIGEGADDLAPVNITLDEDDAFIMPDYDVVIKVYFAAHTWSEPTYTWEAEGEGWKCTATRECTTEGCDAVETETVTATYAVTTDPTCEGAGVGTYTATFENEAFETKTKTVDLDPIGHDWDTPTYTWDENNNCTAERVCKNDATHKETELAPGIGEVTKPATCLIAGETTYTATFANEAFEPQTKVVADVDPIGHDWDEPTYEWATDNSTVTATRVCKNDESHVETETVNTTSEVKTPATCEGAGTTTYTATFTNEAFETQTKDVEDIEATGHDWDEPTYEWAADNSTVTATRVCKNDESHVETETVNTTSEVKTPATCEGAGTTTYTATFENEAFETQTKDVEDIEPIGHDWDEPTYEWAADNSTVTATRVCKNDESHVETETVNTTSEVKTPATCEGAGTTTYTATFENEAFETQTKDVEDIEATGHDWDEPTYEWAADNSTVTATRVCKNDESHVETETVNTTSEVKTPATCEGAGTTTYTATFENEAFETQTKDVEDIEAIGHDWDEPTYEWAADNSTVTATRVCKNDESHVETETVNTTSEVKTPATCEGAGTTTYTATFENEAFETQTKDVEDIDPIGHDWDEPTYEWAADNSTVTATRVCKNDESHVETETVNTTSEVKTPATCEGAGTTTYTATFENEAFETQTKDVEDIDPIGHDWDEPTYEWAADNSTVTATRVCKNDESHVETETVNTTSEVKTPATCEGAGTTTYTATFENEAFETQTKDVEDIDPIGHDWDEPTYEWAADNSTVTATRVCKNDESHVETETVNTTSEVKTPATCEGAGTTTYTATFENEAFETQTKDVEDIEAIGHDWILEPTWAWEGVESATATFVCRNDETHVETLDAEITSEVDGDYTVYTATVEFQGETFTDEKRVPLGPAFMTQSLLLSGQIGVRFYVRLPEIEGYEYTGVDFTIEGKDGQPANEAFSSDLPTNSKGYYGFTFYVNTIQMADKITATLNYTVNGETKTLAKDYSVKEYFETFKVKYEEHPELYSDDIANLIKATGDLGHYVQAYLDVARGDDWDIPKDHAEMDVFFTTYTADDIGEAKNAIETVKNPSVVKEPSMIKKVSYALVMDSETAILLTVVPAAGYTGGFTATVSDDVACSVTKVSDKKYEIKVPLMAHMLSTEYTITITAGDGTTAATVKASGLAYVKQMLNAFGDGTVGQNAAIAVWRYSKFADIVHGDPDDINKTNGNSSH